MLNFFQPDDGVKCLWTQVQGAMVNVHMDDLCICWRIVRSLSMFLPHTRVGRGVREVNEGNNGCWRDLSRHAMPCRAIAVRIPP